MQWIQCGYRTPNRLPGNSRGLWTECGSVWKRIKCRVCTYCHFTSLHGWRIICFLLSCIYNQEFSVYYCMLLISPICDKVQGNAVQVWFSLNESTGNIGMFVILALFTKTQIENKWKYTGFNSKLQIHYIRERNTRGPAKVYQGVSCQLSVQTHIGTHLSLSRSLVPSTQLFWRISYWNTRERLQTIATQETSNDSLWLTTGKP